MADPTEEQLKAAARKALAAGDNAAAKRLIAAARKAGAKAAGGQSTAMTDGMAKLSGMSRNPAVADGGDVNAALGITGRRADDPNAEPYSTPRDTNTLEDMVKAGAAGVVRGVTGLADLPGKAVTGFGDLAASGLEGAGIIGPDVASGIRASMAMTPMGGGSTASDAAAIATEGGSNYRGKTTAGEYAGTVGEFLPGALAGPGGIASNVVRQGVIPALASEAAGQMTEGTAAEPWARLAGAVAGGVAPDLAAKGLSKLISPYGGVDPIRLEMAKVLDDFGVPITAGQRVGSEALRRKEGLSTAGQSMSEAQREAFTRAALKTAGTDASRATSEVLEETANRIGAVFDDVTKGLDITPDASALTGISKAVSEYKSLAPTQNQAPLVSNVLRETSAAFRGKNTIPAATVNTWRSGLSKLTASADAATRDAARSALEVIDDMLSSAMVAAGNPQNVAKLSEARGQWRNFLAIQATATKAGEGAAVGLLSPSSLRNAVVAQGKAAYARGGRGDIGDLTRAAEAVIKPLPTSGTAENLRAMMVPSGIMGSLGAAGGASMGDPMMAAAGAALGMALPAVGGAVRMSGPVQSYLANQAMRPAVGPSAASAVIPATSAAATVDYEPLWQRYGK